MSQDPAPAVGPAPVAPPAKPADPPPDREPRRWWQWMFLYPTAAALLLTAVPDWVDSLRAFYNDLDRSKITMAEALARTSRINRNLGCLATPAPLVPAGTSSVESLICDSGDILIRLVTQDGKRAYEIIETARLLAQNEPPATASAAPLLGRLVSMTAEARQTEARMTLGPIAEQVPDDQPAITLAQQYQIITQCQRFLDERMLLRNVQIGGSCFNEIVDTYTGIVVSREQVPCSNTCG
ncbi:hypothetical protein [uncultured Paracoccus sp.]|uniref:hypothetical protein n=1 Tax=uncultured Paracoccus sp. TaxID=189685 RepID=UPI00260D5DA1|nr:hypothetical protein [uncultured Paracoccus sp.]